MVPVGGDVRRRGRGRGSLRHQIRHARVEAAAVPAVFRGQVSSAHERPPPVLRPLGMGAAQVRVMVVVVVVVEVVGR